MKKIILAVSIAAALVLTACTPSGYAGNGGWSNSDWDMNNPSMYNNQTYCKNGTYIPLTGNRYSCRSNGVTSTPSKRPTQVVPPKNLQKAPVKSVPKKEKSTKTEPKKSVPKAPVRKVQKAPSKTKK